MLSIAFFFHRCRTVVKMLAETALIIEGISKLGAELLKIRSNVLSLKQATKRTAIETDGINFSTKEKNEGVFLFAKIIKGRSLRASIIRPIKNVVTNASKAVNFTCFSPSIKT